MTWGCPALAGTRRILPGRARMLLLLCLQRFTHRPGEGRCCCWVPRLGAGPWGDLSPPADEHLPAAAGDAGALWGQAEDQTALEGVQGPLVHGDGAR